MKNLGTIKIRRLDNGESEIEKVYIQRGAYNEPFLQCQSESRFAPTKSESYIIVDHDGFTSFSGDYTYERWINDIVYDWLEENELIDETIGGMWILNDKYMDLLK